MELFQNLAEAIEIGDEKETLALVNLGLQQDFSPLEILNKGLLQGLTQAGQKFKEGEYFIPELMVSTIAMQKALEILKPLMSKGAEQYRGTIVIGTIQGDIHDIGKNIVATMLETAGFRVHNIGVDIHPEQFVTAAIEYKADIIAMSALLTTTMGNMGTVIALLKEQGLRDKIKVMVGGAVVNEKYAHLIGADAYSKDADEAIIVAKNLLEVCR